MKNVFVTTDGKEIPYQSISPVEIQEVRLAITRQAKEKGKQIEPPKYSIKVGDAEQTFLHDEKSIADPKTPQSEKDAWDRYSTDTQELEQEINERISGLVYGEGVILDAVPEEWVERRKWKGLDIPENPYDKRLKYILSDLLKTPEDLQGFVVAVMKLSMSGVSQEVVEAAEETFRNTAQNRQS
jgi:hypothetical protein